MHDISELNQGYLPSNARLIKATLLAMFVAGVLLVTVILPAEYDIDPTGIGTKLGLTALNNDTETNANEAQVHGDIVNESGPLSKKLMAYRKDEMTLPLFPGQGMEIKAIMQQGDHFVFQWESKGGVVNVDMHGEEVNAPPDVYTSYWIEQGQSNASGAFTAPFDGTHGWYWQNDGQEAVEIVLSIGGFYKELYIP